MLIPSPRIKPHDLRVWEAKEPFDHIHATSGRYRAHVDAAEERIAGWTRGKRGYVAVSWGKDSVVMADLCALLTDWPLVWIRVEPIFNPDCPDVRDAFLATHRDARYEEIVVHCREDETGIHATGTLEAGIARARRHHGDAAVLGLRGDESAIRKRIQRIGVWQTDTALCPIIDWSGDDVFAYLAAEALPVHPVYAMSRGGAIPRERLRVSSLMGQRGTGTGRREWERAYYPEYREGR